jgi:hypothetical protein
MKSRTCPHCGLIIVGDTWKEVQPHDEKRCQEVKELIAYWHSPEGRAKLEAEARRLARRLF